MTTAQPAAVQWLPKNDEPTLDDLLSRSVLAREVGEAVTACIPPYVFGIHGAWGSGKTSFLHLLHLYLTGVCLPLRDHPKYASPQDLFGYEWRCKQNIAVVWFEAWRYQREISPIVALLHEIRNQLTTQAKFTRTAKKLTEVAISSGAMSIEQITKYIGIKPSTVREEGERWEREHLAEQLPSHRIREQLQYAVQEMLGNQKKRLVILVDDLDRCEGEIAYQLLEGIKIFLNISNCVFVLAMNERIVQQAVANHLPCTEEEKAHQAREYLEKLCQHTWHLPLINTELLLGKYIHSLKPDHLRDSIVALLGKYDFLPRNPRKVKAFANTLGRFITCGCNGNCIGEGKPTSSRCATLLVILTYLYQFHPDIFQRIEAYRGRFYEELRRWTKETPSPGAQLPDSELSVLLKLVKRTHDIQKTDVTPVPGEELGQLYRDPIQTNVFRIQQLIAESPTITADDVYYCIMRCHAGQQG